jgi:hypothetical protein
MRFSPVLEQSASIAARSGFGPSRLNPVGDIRALAGHFWMPSSSAWAPIGSLRRPMMTRSPSIVGYLARGTSECLRVALREHPRCHCHHMQSARAAFAVSIVLLAAACTGESTTTSLSLLLVSPAPAVAVKKCFFMPIRAERVDPSTMIEQMSGHLPSALPEGFGLVGLFGGGEGSGASRGFVMWEDASCRTVSVETWATSDDIAEGPQVGAFTLTSRISPTCSSVGPTPCFAYRARSPLFWWK